MGKARGVPAWDSPHTHLLSSGFECQPQRNSELSRDSPAARHCDAHRHSSQRPVFSLRTSHAETFPHSSIASFPRPAWRTPAHRTTTPTSVVGEPLAAPGVNTITQPTREPRIRRGAACCAPSRQNSPRLGSSPQCNSHHPRSPFATIRSSTPPSHHAARCSRFRNTPPIPS
jgi:hypothetical protein